MLHEKYFTKIVDSLAAGITVQDTHLNVLYCNDSALKILGLPSVELLGKNALKLGWSCTHEDGTPFKKEDFPSFKVLRLNEAVRDFIMSIKKPNNELTWISINAEPIFGNNPEVPEFVLSSFVDITLLKKKEEALKASNEELERFAYVASHDLQEPLRKVNTFLNLFLNKNKHIIDEKSQIYLSKVEESSNRMQTMINDLLDFSRTHAQSGVKEEINCEEKINYIRDAYEVIPSKKTVRIKAEKLPTIIGYKTQILILFQNLISNGIKYNTSEIPEVVIRCQKRKGDYLFSFQDNGIGINQDDFDKIFLPFHRLHGKSDYPGTGIGLATCKKIVEKHAGQIWLTSDPNKGTTFYFTLPY